MAQRGKPSITTISLSKEGHVSGASVSDRTSYLQPQGITLELEFNSKGEAETVASEVEDHKASRAEIKSEIERLQDKLHREEEKFLRHLKTEYKDNIINQDESPTVDPVAFKKLEEIESKIDNLSK